MPDSPHSPLMGQNLKNGAKLLGGELLQMGKTKWGKIKKNGAKVKNSRPPRMSQNVTKCHRIMNSVTENCHRINIMPHFEKNGASVEKMSQNGRIRGRF